MADETHRPDDVSSMMEELWGPRGEAPADDIARPRRARSEVEALRSDLDAALAHLVEKLAGVRDEAVAAADARVAGAEIRLLSRLDEIAAGVGQAVQRSTIDKDVLARLDAVEREASERWLALEERVAPQPHPVDVGPLRSEVQADVARMLEVQRTELEQAFDSRIGEIQAELATLSASGQQLDQAQWDLGRTLEGLADKISRPADAGLEAADAIERRVTEAVDKLADRLGARQAELEARVEQLQAALDGEAARVEAAVDRADQVATTLESQGRELQALRKGLAKAQEPVTVPGGGDLGRLQVLEEHTKETDYEMSQLGDLHAALDVGMGSLRSEMAELRDSMRKMADDHAELFDQVEGSAGPRGDRSA